MRRSALWSAFVLLVAAALYGGCTQDFDQFTSGTGGASSTSNSSTGAGNNGGSGGGMPCDHASDCPQAPDCEDTACVGHQCKTSPSTKGTGCVVGGTTCDGDGHCVECNAPADCGDAAECVQNTCSPQHHCGTTNDPTTATCGVMNAQHCDGKGNCGCTKDSQCKSDTVCAVASCDMTDPDNKHCITTPTMTANMQCSDHGGAVCDTMGTCVACTATSGNCGGTAVCVNETCCTPATVAMACGNQCSGQVPDTCGGMVNCDTSVCGNPTNFECDAQACCPKPDIGTVCGNQCGGFKNDTCAVSRDCSANTCTSPNTCGGGGTMNQCGCTKTPKPMACSNMCNGGMVGDGCGGMYNCNDDASCSTGHCADAVCCDTACTATCMACNLAGNSGTCSQVDNAQDSPTCDDSHGGCGAKCICNATGNCKRKNGEACSPDGANATCASGTCTGGMCM